MALDLRALKDEEIEELGYGDHELWLVKFQDEIYGPFEEQALKHYALDNEPLFEESFAARKDQMQWEKFFSYACFTPVMEKARELGKIEKYWLLEKGMKSGPFSKEEIFKRIEIGLINPTTPLSKNDGHEWFKLSQLKEFSHEVTDISQVTRPHFVERAKVEDYKVPSSVQDKNAELVNMLGNHQHNTKSFNLKDFKLQNPDEPVVNKKLRWFVPSLITATLAVVVGVRVLTHNASDEALVDISPEESSFSKPVSATQTKPSLPNPSSQGLKIRKPASYHQPAAPVREERSALTQPTYQQEHFDDYSHQNQDVTEQYPEQQNDYYAQDNYEQDDQGQPINKAKPIPSLVRKRIPAQSQEDSLDYMMNEMPEQPVVEEVGDF